ncbi:hypothetical protein SAMN05216464_102357 [Mucilaginibacter pineti]|uniref:Fasciclin domain-containing protein n=1 Tax=Mucilaginibacter pineti TaxID=1391627 RepID=A0A1G6WZY5_9SPHI|nr:hypothetical protein [Mucilaginibacter pineti]SDD71438.1 hypothetical protein SAMN05216464_102357 [Mucilaginibacter pineti]
MRKYISILCICFAAFLIASCKKDGYKNDGGVSDPHVNMTTYDFLKSKPQFDSLVRMIDRAGLKDVVNSNITFFATTNYGIVPYVAAKKFIESQTPEHGNNENFDFGIKDLPVKEISDSLKTYMFAGKINRDQITLTGKLYDSLLGPIPAKPGQPNSAVKYEIKFRRAFDYSSYVDHVDYVDYIRVTGSRDDQQLDPSTIPDAEKDLAVDCQTSGIITTTGIVHVLDGHHRLFFNAQSTGN